MRLNLSLLTPGIRFSANQQNAICLISNQSQHLAIRLDVEDRSIWEKFGEQYGEVSGTRPPHPLLVRPKAAGPKGLLGIFEKRQIFLIIVRTQIEILRKYRPAHRFGHIFGWTGYLVLHSKISSVKLCTSDHWHLDEMVMVICGKRH